MSDVDGIPSEMYSMPPIRIPPCECGHEEIPSESCEHHEDELLGMDESREKSCKHQYHAECEQFTSRIGDNRKFRFENGLEIAHE